MTNETVTFFMPVTDKDAVIADYAIASYRRLGPLDIPFRLIVYCNNLSPRTARHHIPRWISHEYVDLHEAHLSDVPSPYDEEDEQSTSLYYQGALASHKKVYRYEGPWERHDRILDRELKRISTPYIATVDADFEILSGDFVQYGLKELHDNDNLKVVASDYSATRRFDTNAFSTGYCYLQERYHTWFCLYKREALEFPESHRYRDVWDSRCNAYLAWDTSAYLQFRLRQERGYDMTSLEQFNRSFIHYGRFSKNRRVNERNVWLYRALTLSPKIPLIRQAIRYRGDNSGLFSQIDTRLSRLVATGCLPLWFDESERDRPVYASEYRG